MQTYRDPAKVIDFSLLLEKIILCRKGNGKEFVSMLTAIDGDKLTFRTRNGKYVINYASEIVYAAEI